MAKDIKTGSVKRLGSRYGRTVREKLGKIEALQKGPHKCPYCHNYKVKRIATGIWQCQKCNSKFTSKAYFVARKIKISEKEEEKTLKKKKEE